MTAFMPRALPRHQLLAWLAMRAARSTGAPNLRASRNPLPPIANQCASVVKLK